MKKIFATFLMVTSIVLGLAYPVRIQSWDLKEDVKTINSLNISIDNVSHRFGTIMAFVRNEAEHDLLLQRGFDAQRVPDPSREYYEFLRDNPPQAKDSTIGYYSVTEYSNFMQNMASAYPNLCQLVQWGTSVQNRPLYALKISDNVSVNEAQPEVKLIASIHGDEPVGYVMMLRAIERLLSDYGTDPRITDIVNNTELWICPLMNPDGYVLGQRYNAHGVDLNRNFPMPTGVTNPDGNATAQETIAMMTFSEQHNFVHGINFHGGALVMNYPWDYTYTRAPDDLMLQDMALTYSIHNTPMYNSNEFDQGITNGADWYVITGSMQDWNYHFTSNIELTAEIGNTKWPPSSTLDSYWADNQESILSYIEYAQKGIKGIITDGMGIPIPGTITITGNERITRNDPVVGDYHRLLLPGDHEVKISAPGHLPQTANVTVPTEGYVVHDVSLQPAMTMSLYGTVRDRDGYALPNVNVQLSGDEDFSVTTAADGTFYLAGFIEGDYQARFSRDGQGTVHQPVELRRHRTNNHLVFVLDAPLFYEDFEDGLSDWTATPPWATVWEDGSMVLTDSPDGNYGNNINRSIRLTEPISLIGIDQPVLSFRAKWDLESGYDYVYVEASSDGNDWAQLGNFTGYHPDWADQLFSLDNFMGGIFHLRFRIRTDRYVTADGIYIDDVSVSGRDLSMPIIGDLSQDGIIDGADVKALLAYTVGGELSAEQLISADVDLTDGVKTVDAQQILHYIRNADFRFPAQSFEDYVLPEVEITARTMDDTLFVELGFELRSLHLDIPYPIDSVELCPQDDQPYFSFDPSSGLFSLVHDIPIAGNALAFALINPDTEFVMDAEVNGHAVQIEVGGGNPSPPQSPALPLALQQNYPNPFNPQTTITLQLPSPGEISLEVFNLRGQRVRTLMDGALPAGEHTAVFDGKDAQGRPLSTGIYLYRLQTPGGSITKRMVLSK